MAGIIPCYALQNLIIMNRILSIFFVLLFSIVMACKEETPAQKTLSQILADGQWSITSVIHEDEGDLTSYYTGFTIDFKETSAGQGTYTVENGGEIFADNGTWTLEEGTSTNFLDLSNGLTIDAQISENALTMSFLAPSPGGRIMSLGGNYIFSFNR